MTHRAIAVDSSGLAEHPDQPGVLVRCALGAFGNEFSLWSSDAPQVPWLTEELFESTLEMLAADETADREVVTELLANAERSFGGIADAPTLRPVLVPLLHGPVFDNRVKRLGLSGGRNSMKTWSAMTWAVLELAANPVNIIFARQFQNSMRDSSHRAVADRIRALGLGGFDIQRNVILHRNGGEISFIGLERHPDSVRSKENVRAVVVEEAHVITQNSISILEPTLRRPGARAIYVWNRVKESDPVDAMFYGSADDNEPPVIHTTWEDNPFVPPSVVQDVIRHRSRDPEGARHTWGGLPKIRSDARVFPDSSFRVADIDDQVPERLAPRWGADFGDTHPSVLVQLYVWGRTLYIRDEAYQAGVGVDETPALFAGSSPDGRWANPRGFPGIPGARTARIRADSAGKAYIRHLKKVGFTRIKPAKKGPGSIENGVARIKSFDIVIHPRCVHTLDEFRTHQRVVDRKTEEVTDEYEDANNHAVDAIRYALETVR